MHKPWLYLSAAALALATLTVGALTSAGDNPSSAARSRVTAHVHLVASNSLPVSVGRQEQFVLCPQGEIALGGGAVPVKDDVTTPQVDATLIASYPIARPLHPIVDAAPAPADDVDVAEGWAAIMTVGQSNVNTFLRVYAICAPRPPSQ